jgi:hypothetical protein
MVGLLDIAPLTKTVTVNGTAIEVTGVSVTGVATLMRDYPVLAKMLTGTTVAPTDLISIAPDAIAAVLAAGTGTPGNKKAEEIAARLPLEAQVDLLEAIIALTMPGGFGPFVERLTGLFSMGELPSLSASPASTGKDQDTSSPEPSSG